jgi:amino acid transporter/Trk K+ transport system NAD-binding subunit
MAPRITFRRNMGLFMAVMIGIGATMGPGIFALPGELAQMIGPLGLFVYLAMGLLTLFTALNYSELSAAIPLAGGGYSFTSRTMASPIAFLTGWFFWIGNTLACAMYAVIFALTIRTYFLPDASIAVICVATTLVFTAVNFFGAREAILVITVMNLIELVVLVTIAALGLAHVEPANLQPLAPMGWGPFIPAMALIYISYVGFELISNAAEEIIEPGKNIPRAILITLGVSTAIYVFVVGVMMATVHHSELASSEIPFIFTADRLFGPWGRWAGVTATIMASLSAFSVTLGASARILYALGRDRHFPQVFCRLHPRFQTPHVALVFCALIVVVFGSTGIVKFVASVSDFGYLMGLGIINFAVIPLHKKMPNLRRPFQTWWFPVIPILGIITTWMFVPALEFGSFVLGGVLTAFGLAVYLVRPANREELASLARDTAKRVQTLLARLRSKPMQVLIISGNRLGQNIANRLLAKEELRVMFRSAEHQVTFIEEDEARCKELERRYACPIYQGDGTRKELLEQVGLSNVDVVIAAYDDDGRNVIAALQARQLGHEKVIAVVQEPEYTELLETNQITAISAPWATAAMVENLLDRPGLAQLYEFGIGAASLMDAVVPADARVVGKSIAELQLPHECLIAAIIRDNTFVVPKGKTTIEADDRVVFIGPAVEIRKASDMFSDTK